MTEATVAANIHQALDVHGHFTAQIAFQSELRQRFADFFQVLICQILDFFGVINATSFANLACARTTDAINGREANFSVLMRRNVDTSNTCHVLPLLNLVYP